jgi:lysophospholipase L1-like esterase
MNTHSYLALGDSYTIGEGVAPEENFPSQVVAMLNNAPAGAFGRRQAVEKPDVLAKTGWTTDELDAAITAAGISRTYDIVSLLVGVNNQYRGRSVEEYGVQFGQLLQRAIHFAGGEASHVFVLSVPDWGVTPFAEGRDRQGIARAIDEFNATARNGCQQQGVTFIDITSSQRLDGNKPEFLAPDGLHPSGKEYTKWAVKLSAFINTILK